MADLAVALGQRVVGDLADERLDERVLAALGAAGVGLVREQLAPHERPQPRLEVGLLDPGHDREPGQREALAEDGGVHDEAPVGRVEAVEPGGDQRGQRLRDGQGGEVAGRGVRAVARLVSRPSATSIRTVSTA